MLELNFNVAQTNTVSVTIEWECYLHLNLIFLPSGQSRWPFSTSQSSSKSKCGFSGGSYPEIILCVGSEIALVMSFL